MFADILSLFTSNPVHRLALVSSIASNVLKTFDQEFAQDKGCKDAAIDSLIELLKANKNGVAEVVEPAKASP